VVSATCLVALGVGAAIGHSLTRDTHVGRGTIGNALAPEPGRTNPDGGPTAPTTHDVTALATAPPDEETAAQTLA
jgi:hypothetical protein